MKSNFNTFIIHVPFFVLRPRRMDRMEVLRLRMTNLESRAFEDSFKSTVALVRCVVQSTKRPSLSSPALPYSAVDTFCSTKRMGSSFGRVVRSGSWGAEDDDDGDDDADDDDERTFAFFSREESDDSNIDGDGGGSIAEEDLSLPEGRQPQTATGAG